MSAIELAEETAAKPAPEETEEVTIGTPAELTTAQITSQFSPPNSAPLLTKPIPSQDPPVKKKKRQYNIKNPNRPKRPLSAYNVFFKYERERLVREAMLKGDDVDKEKVEEIIAIRETTKTGKRVHRKTHGAIPFAELGRLISTNWKALSDDERAKYAAEASIDKERYQREVEECQAAMAASESTKQAPGPKIRNKRLGDAPVGIPDGKRMNYEGYEGPPPYYDPWYGRPPPPEGYGPPPGYGGPPPPSGPYGYGYPPPPPDYYFGRPPPMTPGAEGAPKDGTPQQYPPPYPYPYPGYPSRPPVPMQAPNSESNPNPMNSPQRWMPHANDGNQPQAAECAYQCEICNNAVFSTFKACADHEEECAKRFAKGNEEEQRKPMPQPTAQKTEEKEQQDAVEAVLLLKTGAEEVDV